MNRLITERLALATMATILSLVVLFHLLTLTGIIPFDIVWGGRLASRGQMLRMEMVSVLLNLLMLTVVGLRARRFGKRVPARVITAALWVMCGLFFLNTIGNLLAQSALERILFTPLTLILSLLCFRLASVKREKTVAAG